MPGLLPAGAGSDARIDDRLMTLAVAIGRRNLGLTWPNPSVGAVLVDPRRDGPVIWAQGVTAPSGRPHAEPIAIGLAGAAARGATLYVSLEPCSHHGRTPPCVDAIMAAGIGRVVAAIEDPDPRVAGRGLDRLRRAGIAVESGIGRQAGLRAHRGHLSRIRSGRPFVTLKLARTRDGIAGRRSGPRLMITGDAAWARTHLMRAQADAIMVGIGTVLADDPRLDVRLPGLAERRPVRVVLDSALRLPSTTSLVRTAHTQPSWVLGSTTAPSADEARLRAAGLAVIRVPADDAGRVDLGEALQMLARHGLTSILCEGGPALADALAGADLVDEVVLMTGPDEFGMEGGGVPALGPALASALGTCFNAAGTESLGPDRIAVFERIAPCSPGS